MSDIVLELKKVNKLFGNNHVIHDVDLKIERGKFITFLGPSGCGKTTLLRMIAGFYEVDRGEILLNGERVDKLPPYKRRTPMVFQEYALFPHMTVFENISYGLKLRKNDKNEMKKTVQKVVGLMQLKGMEERYPNQLSGGQQQRVAIARALVMNPEVLLLDEPLSNLDAKLRESVRVELRLIQQKLGLTVIYVTHDQQEALSMSDKIVVFNKGFINQYGAPREIYFEPKTKFVADFIGTTNFIEGKINEVNNNQVTMNYNNKEIKLFSNLDLQKNSDGVISIRPESIRLSKNEDKKCALNLKVNIKHSMFLGEKVRYFVVDEFKKEWIVDIFDSGKNILDGNAVMNIDENKAHLICE